MQMCERLQDGLLDRGAAYAHHGIENDGEHRGVTEGAGFIAERVPKAPTDYEHR